MSLSAGRFPTISPDGLAVEHAMRRGIRASTTRARIGPPVERRLRSDISQWHVPCQKSKSRRRRHLAGRDPAVRQLDDAGHAKMHVNLGRCAREYDPGEAPGRYRMVTISTIVVSLAPWLTL